MFRLPRSGAFAPADTAWRSAKRPFIGLDFRFTELQAAVLLAQLQKAAADRSRLAGEQETLQGDHRRGARHRVPRAARSGGRLRDHADGDLAQRRIGTARSPASWEQRWRPTRAGTSTTTWSRSSSSAQSRPKNVPSRARPTRTRGATCATGRACCPGRTPCLARSLNISIGVSDPGLSSAFGVTINDGLDVVEERARASARSPAGI